jgi:phosphoribosylformylglycinamidine cyclo-ligase
VLVIPPESENQVRSLLPEAFPIGEVVAANPGESRVLGLEQWGSLTSPAD